jgi:DNA polymerase-3 subunit epsilon
MKLSPILVVDTETTSLSPSEGKLIEIAVAVYDVDHGGVLEIFASLVREAAPPANAAESVNRISIGLLEQAPMIEYVQQQIRCLAPNAEIVVAHNAAFDRAWVKDVFPSLYAKRWICTMHDVPWQCKPELDTRISLVQLLLAHGLGVAHAHRAAVDVESITRLFNRVAETAPMTGINVRGLLLSALSKKARLISLAPFDEKDKVRACGFTWNPEKRVWQKTVFADKAAQAAASLAFKTRIESVEVEP